MLRLARGFRTPRSVFRGTLIPQSYVRHASKWRNENRTDDRIEFKWFLLIGVFGTMVYVTVMQRIQEQDHSKNADKYKKTFTEEEWNSYVQATRAKHLTLEHGEESYLVPFTHGNKSSSKVVKQLVDKLGGVDHVGVVDLNELVEDQLKNGGKYHVLLRDTLEGDEGDKVDGFRYQFTYKLKPGLFTQIVNDEILRQKNENGSLGRFLLLNYPPNIKEAIKFEQNVCKRDTLLTLQDDNNEMVDYFSTVDKVKRARDLTKLEPLIVSSIEVKHEVEIPPSLHVLPDEKPGDDAPAIMRAQYELRQRGEPIRLYGETDVDVIKRLKNLQN